MKEIISDDGLTQTVIRQSGDQFVTSDIVPAKRVERILDANKAVRDNQNRQAQGRHVASIPPTIYENWKREYQTKKGHGTWKQFLIAKLNDPDNKFLRTTSGTIGITSQDRG